MVDLDLRSNVRQHMSQRYILRSDGRAMNTSNESAIVETGKDAVPHLVANMAIWLLVITVAVFLQGAYMISYSIILTGDPSSTHYSKQKRRHPEKRRKVLSRKASRG